MEVIEMEVTELKLIELMADRDDRVDQANKDDREY